MVLEPVIRQCLNMAYRGPWITCGRQETFLTEFGPEHGDNYSSFFLLPLSNYSLAFPCFSVKAIP